MALSLIDADWCLLMLIDADWCWSIMIEADWCSLILIHADWCSLVLMLMLIMMLIAVKHQELQTSEHTIAPPSDGNFFTPFLFLCDLSEVPLWQAVFNTKYRTTQMQVLENANIGQSNRNLNTVLEHFILPDSCQTTPPNLSNAECDIHENFDTNECPNIFGSTKLHEWISKYIHANFFDTNECPNKYLYWKLHEYSNIFEYSSRFYTLTHSPTNVRIYLYKQIWHERMSEYIRKRKIDTNECPNIYSWPIYSNIWIFEYIRHTLVWAYSSCWYPAYLCLNT